MEIKSALRVRCDKAVAHPAEREGRGREGKREREREREGKAHKARKEKKHSFTLQNKERKGAIEMES